MSNESCFLALVIPSILCGGDKSTSEKDIEDAKVYWRDYMSRKQMRPHAERGNERKNIEFEEDCFRKHTEDINDYLTEICQIIRARE